MKDNLFNEIIQAVEKSVPSEYKQNLYVELLEIFEGMDDVSLYVDDLYGISDALDNVIDERYYSGDLYTQDTLPIDED